MFNLIQYCHIVYLIKFWCTFLVGQASVQGTCRLIYFLVGQASVQGTCRLIYFLVGQASVQGTCRLIYFLVGQASVQGTRRPIYFLSARLQCKAHADRFKCTAGAAWMFTVVHAWKQIMYWLRTLYVIEANAINILILILLLSYCAIPISNWFDINNFLTCMCKTNKLHKHMLNIWI